MVAVKVTFLISIFIRSHRFSVPYMLKKCFGEGPCFEVNDPAFPYNTKTRLIPCLLDYGK